MDQNKYDAFLFFSIGPVQEFISASRKTKDLFAGSNILSRLSGKVVEIINNNRGEVIFPYTSVNTLNPNRIFAEIGFDYGKQVAEKAKDEALILWQALVTDAKDKFSVNGDALWDMLWCEQTKNFFEVFYIVHKYDTTKSYGENYRIAEHELGMRKLMRNFEEIKYYDFIDNVEKLGQPNIKCSILPIFTALYTQKHDTKTFWKNPPFKGSKKIFRKNERLSSIAITKRLFSDNKKSSPIFPSTSIIASGGFYRDVVNKVANDDEQGKGLKENINRFVEEVEKYEGDFNLSASNFPSLIERTRKDIIMQKFLNLYGSWKEAVEDMSDDEKKKITKTETIRREVENLFVEMEITKPSKYYAVLLFDGDNMGKWLAGNNPITKQDFSIDAELHKKISKGLSDFSASLTDILERNNHLGKVIYCGGDDVLAFAALDDLLQILDDINSAFIKTAKSVGGGLESMSISSGVAIAHENMNLRYVLDNCRNTEQFAKNILSRDAVAFSILRRSGEHTLNGAKWFFGDSGSETIKLMKEFSYLLSEKIISTSLVYDLRRYSEIFVDKSTGNNIVDKIILSEIKRLIKRRTKSGKESEADSFISNLEALYNKLRNVNYSPPLQKKEHQYNQLVGILEVSQFITLGGER